VTFTEYILAVIRTMKSRENGLRFDARPLLYLGEKLYQAGLSLALILHLGSRWIFVASSKRNSSSFDLSSSILIISHHALTILPSGDAGKQNLLLNICSASMPRRPLTRLSTKSVLRGAGASPRCVTAPFARSMSPSAILKLR